MSTPALKTSMNSVQLPGWLTRNLPAVVLFLALVVMTMATRRSLRGLWLTGAGLLAVVVGKLFLVDLANSGTVERIVSFVVVGILLLVIGWFSPVPPRTDEGGAA